MYDFSKIEEKWNKYWKDNNTFKTDVWDFTKPKYYALDMFPIHLGLDFMLVILKDILPQI